VLNGIYNYIARYIKCFFWIGLPTLLRFLKENVFIVLILLLGVTLRIYNLDSQSLWFDEAYSYKMSRLGLIGIVKAIVAESENHPPVYYWILHLWTSILGYSEFSLRLLSALTGSLCIPLIYLIGKTMFNRTVGLLAALILATSSYQIYYSQEARSYIPMVFLALLSYYFFIRLMERCSFRGSLGYLLSGIILLYTHFYGVLIIVAQNAYYLTRLVIGPRPSVPPLRKWIVMQLILVGSVLPQVYLLMGSSALTGDFWIPKPNLNMIAGSLLEFSGSWPLFILFFLLCLWSIINARELKRGAGFRELLTSVRGYSTGLSMSNIERVYLLSLLILVPIVLPVVLSIFYKPLYQTKYAIPASIALYLLAAKGIDNIRRREAKLFVAALVLALSVVSVHHYYGNPEKHEWRGAARYVEANARDGDLVIIYPKHEIESANYYFGKEKLKVTTLNNRSGLNPLHGPGDIWIISSYHGDMIEREHLPPENRLLQEKEFRKIKIYRLEGLPE